MTKIVKSFTLDQEIAMDLEKVSRLLEKSASQYVNELLQKNMITEAVIHQVQIAEAKRKMEVAQLQLLEK